MSEQELSEAQPSPIDRVLQEDTQNKERRPKDLEANKWLQWGLHRFFPWMQLALLSFYRVLFAYNDVRPVLAPIVFTLISI